MATVPDLMLDAGLPANIDAEKTILGAILLDNAAHAEAAESLKPDDFALDSHRRIFLRMSELIDTGHAVDIVTLSNELAKYKEIEAVGGVAYLASLTEGLPRRPVIEDYVRIVKDKSLLRRLMGICSSAIAKAADQSQDAIGVLDETESRLLEVSEAGLTRGLQPLDAIVRDSFGSIDNLYKQSREITGLATSFIDLDRMTSGLQKGELVIIAARPSMGSATVAEGLFGPGRPRKAAKRLGAVGRVAHLHRRLGRRLAGRNARQGPPSEAELRRPGPDRDRLFAVDVGHDPRREKRLRKPRARGFCHFARPESHGQRARGSGRRPLAAFP
jgi:phosphopantetheine adenylyltransferase